MSNKILTAIVALGIAFAPVIVLADGMPDEKRRETVSPLDKALMEIQGTDAKEAPVDLTAEEKRAAPPEIKKPPKMAQPEPTKIQTLPPKKKIAPAPERRVVQVQPDSSFFGLSVGLYDAFTNDKLAASFSLEWQPGVKIAGVLQPLFGAFVTTNGALYGYTGIGLPFKLTDHVMLMPSVAAGAYHEGDGVDLDETLAFRFGTELAYEFENKSRIGLNAHIITNGKSLDSDDRTEVISLVYTTPLQSFAEQYKSLGIAKAEEKKLNK